MGLRQLLIRAAAVAYSIPAAIAVAGGGPQNVAVIINASDPDSLAVANAYIALRNIPPCNVIYSGWGTNPIIHANHFRDRILKPTLAELERRGVAKQIDCLTYSSGFPYLVECSKLFAGVELPRTARPVTSLTSATYLYQYLVAERHEMFFGNVNLYYAPTLNGVTSSRGFSAQQEWKPAGTGQETAGLRYYLSTALGVTHGRGNTPAEVLRSLQRAKESDGANYRGTIYYMRNNDVRSQTRHEGYQAAVTELKKLGVKAVVENGKAPLNKPDVAGLTTGIAQLPLATSNSLLLPGALVDNLTSYGAKFQITPNMDPQSRISEFIRLGAAGASGAVVEPHAIASKFPSPALHVHYVRGCSLAESFYQAIAAPCHLLVIGDPLCQPWAKPPKVAMEGLEFEPTLNGMAKFRATASYPDRRQTSRFELFIDGVRQATVDSKGEFSLETTVLADGWHQMLVVAVDDTPIAVQGHWRGEFRVKNGTGSLHLSLTEPRSYALGEEISIRAMSTSSNPTEVRSNGRVLGTIKNGSGTLQISSNLLGGGPVEFTGRQTDSPALQSRPLRVEIK